jgi:hypothetical protein
VACSSLVATADAILHIPNIRTNWKKTSALATETPGAPCHQVNASQHGPR